MQSDKKKIWFPTKRYGWGWGPPCAWQGWVVMAVWVILLSGGGFLLPAHRVLFAVYAVILCGALVIVCYLKGEKPRWRWGGEDK